jgi:radical SAM protein with 4Fe4S-binding SPASM domain
MENLILEKKRDFEQEYTLHLFEYCNLSCAFCWQDHDAKIGIDTVTNKLAPIEKFLQKEKRSSVIFNAMGGEVFAPEVFTHEILQAYKDLSLGIKDLCDKYGKQFKINWVTNLVTDKFEFIDDLLEFSKVNGVEANIVTSYDPRGRFNRKSFEMFKRSMEYYKDKVLCVSMLLSKPNVEHMLKYDDPYFRELYDSGKYIYFDYYMPDQSAEYQFVSDTLLYQFFKFLIDKYPNVDPVKAWIENDFNYLSCRTSKLVLADGTMCLCGNLVQDEKSIKQYKSKIERKDNSGIENNFINKYNCLACEYFSRCGMGCFMRHDYKFMEELDECVYKLTHRYIDDVRLQRGIKPYRR